jgi:hypothetical protein
MNTDAMTRNTTTELRIMLRMAYPGNAESKTNEALEETGHMRALVCPAADGRFVLVGWS